MDCNPGTIRRAEKLCPLANCATYVFCNLLVDADTPAKHLQVSHDGVGLGRRCHACNSARDRVEKHCNQGVGSACGDQSGTTQVCPCQRA